MKKLVITAALAFAAVPSFAGVIIHDAAPSWPPGPYIINWLATLFS